jgi:pyruvate/2-oxoglutarate dehydrogenase complex dihydrolipoamide dehydrogenase (E3) component
MKALIEKEGNRILGFTAFGVWSRGSHGRRQVAMAAGLPYAALRDMVLTHATMAEGLVALFSAVPRG